MAIFSDSTVFSQQVLVNKAWSASFGNPSQIDWSASVLDGGGNIITAGHTVISATKTALLLIRQSPDGTTLWQKQFTIANASKNFGIALTTDNANNIYVAGTCYESDATGKYNMLSIKYNFNGTKLWHKTYNGNANEDDGAVSILCNASGSDVYVTGPSVGTNSEADYLTLKLNGSTGATVWEQRYNNTANLNDIPVALSFDASGKIVVAGGSATDALNYDIMTMKYNTSGTFSDSLRITNPGNGYDQASSLFKDNAGNLYITGSTTTDGTNYDILTIKLNNSLDLVWKKTYDDSGLEDRATSVCVNNAGKVYVAGFTTIDANTKQFVAIKYTTDGNTEWVRKYGEDDKVSLASKGMLDGQGNLVLTGMVKLTANAYWLTLQYDAAGNIKWVKEGQETTGTADKPTSVQVDAQGGIYVTGILYVNGAETYTTVKYTQYTRYIAIEYQYEPDTIPLRVSNELIIRFRPEVLDTTFINDNEQHYGDLDAIVTDAALISEMDAALGAGGAIGRWKLLKIFGFLTTAPLMLTSKSGHPVEVPTLWTALILVLEPGAPADEPALAQALHPLEGVVYAQTNGVATGDTNDPLYNEQHSLWDTPGFENFNNAHINIEPAWDEVSGSDGITVAVFDSGIDFRHEDFGFLENETGYGSSVVNGGWDFDQEPDNSGNYPPLYEAPIPDESGHGTNGAGIIGAIRNNQTGVAGIAGGDYSNAQQPIAGVHLHGMKMLKKNAAGMLLATDDKVNRTMLYALMHANPLHDIANHSWGRKEENFPAIQTHLLREVFRLSYEMGVTNVCSRGNTGNEELRFPSCFRDNWIISTGASGTDGLRVNLGNSGPGPGQNPWSSTYGQGMDIVSPGAFSTIKTTGIMSQGGYNGHSGTSAAAPHAAGVAALVLEHLQNKYDGIIPATEDIEHYLEYGATDITDEDECDNCLVGYEDEHGWGRLNAGAAVDLANDYKPLHISVSPTLVEAIPANEVAAFAYNYNDQYKGVESQTPTYSIVGYKRYSADISINICQYNNGNTIALIVELDLISKSPYWIRNAYTYIWGPAEEVANQPYASLLYPENNIIFDPVVTPTVSADQCIFTARLTGYSYDIYDSNGENIIAELPFVPAGEERKFEITLLISDPDDLFSNDLILTHTDNADMGKSEGVKIRPNPSHDRIYLELYPDIVISEPAVITNACGQIVLKDIMPRHGEAIDIGTLPSGMYFLQFRNEDALITQKFIKL